MVSLALTTMVVAATHPQAVSTPVVGLAALVLENTVTNPTGDAMVDIFDYKALQADPDDDVLSIGGGSDDAAALAELLDSTDPSNNVFHINYEFDARAKVQVLTVFTDSNALAKHDAKPPVDQSGGVDCTGATICRTDPRTHTTTITYPDGVVAVIDRINDLAVAAETLGAAVLGHLNPAHLDAPAPSSAPQAAPAPDPVPAAEPAPASVDPPAAPAADTGPRLNVVRPAPNFSPGRSSAPGSSTGANSDLSDTTDKFVNDVVTRVTDTVHDTVNRLLNRDATSGMGRTGGPPSTGEQ